MTVEEMKGKDIRVAAYCRIRSSDPGHESSTEILKKQHTAYAERYGWKISRFYFDEGKGHEKRVLLVEACRAGEYDLIICRTLSRLDTDLDAARRLMEELAALEKPVGILFAVEDLYSLEDNASATLRFLALLADEESRQKAIRITCRRPAEKVGKWQSIKSPGM